MTREEALDEVLLLRYEFVAKLDLAPLDELFGEDRES